jgi:hypothetical protein
MLFEAITDRTSASAESARDDLTDSHAKPCARHLRLFRRLLKDCAEDCLKHRHAIIYLPRNSFLRVLRRHGQRRENFEGISLQSS